MGSGWVFAGVAGPGQTSAAQYMRTGLSLLRLPAGNIRMSYRYHRPVQRHPCLPVFSTGYADRNRLPFRYSCMRMGVPFRLPLGFAGKNTCKKIHTAAMGWAFSICCTFGYGVVGAVPFRRGTLALCMSPLPCRCSGKSTPRYCHKCHRRQ